MEHRVKDKRGRIPNYVISNGRLVHQMSGLSVPLVDRGKAALRTACRVLAFKVWTYERK